jgi:hypothetical protein
MVEVLMFYVTYRRGNGEGGVVWWRESMDVNSTLRLFEFSASIYCNPGVIDAYPWFVLSSGVKLTNWGKEECSPIFVNIF